MFLIMGPWLNIEIICISMRIFSEISMFQDWGQSTFKIKKLVIDQFDIYLPIFEL